MANPKAFPILTDHLGTPRKVLDGDTGEARWAWDAKQPFGHELPNETPTSGLAAFAFDLRFPGQRYDHETGLFHNGFRDYHPGLGRYVQSDPLGLEAGWNTFSYAEGDPLGGMDPYGLEKVWIFDPNQESNASIVRTAVATPDRKGVWSVWVHSNNRYAISIAGKEMYPEELLGILKSNGWKNGQPIVLYACDSGRGDNSFAEQLSKISNGQVVAPTARVWVRESKVQGVWQPASNPKGELKSGPTGKAIPDKSKPGIWRSFGGRP